MKPDPACMPIRIFGVPAAESSLPASAIHGYARLSVWCFFAALAKESKRPCSLFPVEQDDP